MIVTYVGANTRKGVSDKTNNAYEVSELTYAVRDDLPTRKTNPDGSVKWDYLGVGHIIRTIPIDPNVIPSFADVEPFSQVDLVLEPQPTNPSRNWVTGIK